MNATSSDGTSWNDFNVTDVLGKGAYGTVYLAENLKTRQIVALKTIELVENWLPLLAEVNMVIDLSDPTIVNYHSWFFHDGKLVIVMEYCKGGSLTDIMQKVKRSLTEQEISAIMRGLLMALKYIHSLNRIHRDVKSGNLLLTDDGRVKLCDFGVSAQIEKEQRTTTIIGSPFWMAPEVIDSSGHNTSADIWSAGITALELKTGQPPNTDMNVMQVMLYIPTHDPPAPPANSTQAFKNFVSKMLVKDPNQRATADELLQDEFITSVPENKAKDILNDLVNTAANAPSDGEYEYEEEEEDDESEAGDEEYEYEDEEDGFDEPIAPDIATTIMYGDSTFVPIGTMVVSDSQSQEAKSGLSDWKPQFIDTPQPSSKLKKAQKRHFKNFKPKDLENMLAGIRALALSQLAENKIDRNIILKNFEDCRKGIVEEMRNNNADIPLNHGIIE